MKERHGVPGSGKQSTSCGWRILAVLPWETSKSEETWRLSSGKESSPGYSGQRSRRCMKTGRHPNHSKDRRKIKISLSGTFWVRSRVGTKRLWGQINQAFIKYEKDCVICSKYNGPSLSINVIWEWNRWKTTVVCGRMVTVVELETQMELKYI